MPEEKYDSAMDTKAHKLEVLKIMSCICRELLDRGEKHDDSKLREPEKSVFDKVTPRLRGLTYGSDAYKKSLKTMGKALDHHYAHNKHHPEYNDVNGFTKEVGGPGGSVAAMDLMDIVEMFCDWLGATRRHDDGDILKSITHNKERFKISDQLANIFSNTASYVKAKDLI